MVRPRDRARDFSVVVHNIKTINKNEIEKQLHSDFKLKDSIVAIEPYPDSPGHHLHIFVRFTQQVSKSTLIDWCERHVSRETGTNEFGTLGHVKVKKMYSHDWHPAVSKYLIDPYKDKVVDTDVPIITRHPPPKAPPRRPNCRCHAFGFEKYYDDCPLTPKQRQGWRIRPLLHPHTPDTCYGTRTRPLHLQPPRPRCCPRTGDILKPDASEARDGALAPGGTPLDKDLMERMENFFNDF